MKPFLAFSNDNNIFIIFLPFLILSLTLFFLFFIIIFLSLNFVYVEIERKRDRKFFAFLCDWNLMKPNYAFDGCKVKKSVFHLLRRWQRLILNERWQELVNFDEESRFSFIFLFISFFTFTSHCHIRTMLRTTTKFH